MNHTPANTKQLVLVRGGGDLATGVAICLHQGGYKVIVTELAQPLVVRRKVAFAEAVFEGRIEVNGVLGLLAENLNQIESIHDQNAVAVLVDPNLELLYQSTYLAIVDARMLKDSSRVASYEPTKVIGLGPGFEGGKNCYAAIETNRGEDLGKIYFKGKPQRDTGVPATVEGRGSERVLYSPVAGEVIPNVEIGAIVEEGQVLVMVGGIPVFAPFAGVVRGMLRTRLHVHEHTKIGDVDPGFETKRAFEMSDKAWSIGNAVLQVISTIKASKAE